MPDRPQRRAEGQPAGDNAIGGDVNVVVVGMHRSGTSAVAGALRAAGLYAGRDEELVGRLAENPAGFVERPDFVDLDNRMLHALGWDWDTPDPVPPAQMPALEDLVAEGRELVRRRLAPGGRWVLKDPRMSLLLPWWRRILLDRFVAVVPLREPAETAWSLAVRDGFSMELGLSLWAAYHRHLALGLEGVPVITVDYGLLSERPEAVVPQLLDELNRLGVEGVFDADGAAGAIRGSLRRHTEPAPDLDQPTGAIRAVRDAWASEPVQTYDRFGLTLPPPSGWESAILLAHRTRREQHDALARAEEELDEARASLRIAERKIEDSRIEWVAQQEQLEAAKLELAQRDRQLEATREQLGSAQADLRAERATAASLTHSLEALRAEVGSVRVEVVARSDQLVALHKRPDRPPRNWGHWPGHAMRWLRTKVLRGAARTLPQAALARLWHNPLFDRAWYVDRYQDAAGKGMHPEQHFRRQGVREGRRPNELFDPAWYLTRYPDVAQSGLNPLDHYLLFGASEGRDPSPEFSTRSYLKHRPDVARAGINPLLHYLRYGRYESIDPRTAPRPDIGASE